MGMLSVRLPEEVEEGLEREAEIAHRSRSDLVREAIGEYVTRKERDRYIAKMTEAARALYSDPATRTEDREIQADLDAIDHSIDHIKAEERSAGIDPNEKWWD